MDRNKKINIKQLTQYVQGTLPTEVISSINRRRKLDEDFDTMVRGAEYYYKSNTSGKPLHQFVQDSKEQSFKKIKSKIARKRFLSAKVLQMAASVIFLIFCSNFISTDFFYEKGNKDGYEKGSKDGYAKGYNDAFISGKLNSTVEAKSIFRTALKGAEVVLVDAKLEKLNPQLFLHKISKEKKEPLIKNSITQFTDSLNYVILNQLLNFGEFSLEKREVIFLKYNKRKSEFSQLVYNRYLTDLKKSNSNTKILAKTKILSNSISFGLCDLLDLLSPLEKAEISQRILEVGNKKNKEENFEESAITSLAKSYVSDQLCNLIITNSMEFILGGLIEYASIIQITKEEFVGKHTIEKVMKLVTAESSLIVGTNMTFERDWAFDPNFYIQAESAVLAGIDLSKFYRVEFFPIGTVGNKKTEIVITIPKPSILSVYSKINPRNNRAFFATTLKDHEIDRIDDTISRISRRKALKAGILTDAEQGAEDALNALYRPLFLNTSQNYELKVNFVEKLTVDENNIVTLKG